VHELRSADGSQHTIDASGGAAMTCEEILNQAMALLQRQGRVSYRALKRQFDLDEAYLEDFLIPPDLVVSGEGRKIM
jgi:hypothetical protein